MCVDIYFLDLFREVSATGNERAEWLFPNAFLRK